MSMRERIQNAAEQDTVIIGRDECLKNIGALDTIVLAANTPSTVTQDVSDAASGNGVTVEPLDVDNGELGSLCMKPFTASVVGLPE